MELIPNASPASGARRCTYNAALQLLKVEQHDGTAYQLVSQIVYDGLGERARGLPGWYTAESTGVALSGLGASEEHEPDSRARKSRVSLSSPAVIA